MHNRITMHKKTCKKMHVFCGYRQTHYALFLRFHFIGWGGSRNMPRPNRITFKIKKSITNYGFSVEPAGVEPASKHMPDKLSTCLFLYYFSKNSWNRTNLLPLICFDFHPVCATNTSLSGYLLIRRRGRQLAAFPAAIKGV